MKQVAGIWLPDHEDHLIPHLTQGTMVNGKGTYQLSKYHAALPYCRSHDMALDIGAHVGLWSRVMARDFTAVLAFEPIAEHCALWRLNVLADNASLLPIALGDGKGIARIATPTGHSSHSTIGATGEQIDVGALDELVEGPVDFIKIDCEGYESFVVRGGERVIRSSRPVMVVEQKPGQGAGFGVSDTAAVEILKGWGAVVRQVIHGDYVMSW